MDGNLKNTQSLTGKIKSLAIDTTLTKKGMCAESKSTGEALATKVNISDIVDDLISVTTDKPLSANQGRILKKQIDDIDPHYAENVIFDNTIAGMYANNVQGAIDEIKSTVGYAKKQLIPYPFSVLTPTVTREGITWTDNGDGTLTTNGTPTGDSNYYAFDRTTNPITLEAGTYIINGCPSGGSNETYRIAILSTNEANELEVLAYDYGDGARFTIETRRNIGITLKVASTCGKVTDLIFKPMIRVASIQDDTFESYKPDLKSNVTYKIALDTTYISSIASERNIIVRRNGWCYGIFQFKVTSNVNPKTHVVIGHIPNELRGETTTVFMMSGIGTDYSKDTSAAFTINSTTNEITLMIQESTVATNKWYFVTFAYPLKNI